jgi:signal transduction histidine kinase
MGRVGAKSNRRRHVFRRIRAASWRSAPKWPAPSAEPKTDSSANPEEGERIAQLRAFVPPMRVVALCFGLLLLACAIAIGSLKIASLASITLLYYAATFVASHFIRTNRIVAATSIITYGSLAIVLIAGLQFPYGDATLVIAGLVAVAVGLPYMQGAELRWFLRLVYVVLVAILCRGFRRDPTYRGVPYGIEFFIHVGGGAAAAYLLLFLLWQSTQRLRRTLERTRQAHRETERARQSAALMVEASRRLSVSSLDYRGTFKSIAQLVVPAIADCCLIDELGADGRLHSVEAVHADSSEQWLLDRLRKLTTPDAEDFGPTVVPALRSILVADVDDDALRKIAPTEAHLDVLRRMGLRSVILVPLAARGRPLGAMLLGRTKASGSYDEHDFALVEELAHRTALAAENARLYAEAQTAIRARDEFLSIASHELRTPLTPLELHIQAVRKRLPEIVRGSLPFNWLEHRLNVIGRQSERLARLIDELLDISRIVGGRLRLELEPVDLSELVRDLADRFQTAGGNGKPAVRIDLDVAASVFGNWDRLRVEQVVANLLSNAVKYGSSRPILLRMRSDGSVATLSVMDRGIGIAEADQERIFARFERAASATQYGGLGLGLFITRQIVEALGGGVRVESELGRGSTFTVELPLAGPPRLEDVQPEPVAH